MDQKRVQQRKRVMDHEVPNEDDFDYDDEWPTRMPSSARRYRTDVRTEEERLRSDVQPAPKRSKRTDYAERDVVIPPRRTATQANMPALQGDRRRTEREIAPREQETEGLEVSGRFRPHWLVFVGLAMLVMVMGWVVFSAVANWWQVTQDDWHYGRPRTFSNHVMDCSKLLTQISTQLVLAMFLLLLPFPRYGFSPLRVGLSCKLLYSSDCCTTRWVSLWLVRK